MSVHMYGIKNCDTVRKARRWLTENDIEFDFQDIRDEPLSKKIWTEIVKHTKPDTLINTRGTTWRKLSDDAKDTSTQTKTVALLIEHPTVMKRPLLIAGDNYHVGFKPDMYQDIFS